MEKCKVILQSYSQLDSVNVDSNKSLDDLFHTVLVMHGVIKAMHGSPRLGLDQVLD